VGYEIVPGTITSDLFAKWLDGHFLNPYSPKTRRVYLSVVSGLLKFKEAQNIRNFTEFNAAWLRRFIGWNPETGTIYSSPYQTLRASALNLFWLWLREVGEVFDNPIANLVHERKEEKSKAFGPTGGNVAKRLPVVLSWADQEVLIRTVKASMSCTSLRDYTLMALILATGLRCDELCSLRLQHIDLKYSRLRVIGKGNKERQIVFEHDVEIVGIVELWLNERAGLLEWKNLESDLLFISRSGRPLSEALVYQQVSKYIKQAGFGDRLSQKGPHVLRHTATSVMFARQVPTLQIMHNLGHSNLSTTQIYAHLLSPQSSEQRQEF